MPPLLIGLVGHMRAGKEELYRYLEGQFAGHRIVRLSSSGFLREILTLLALPASRENLQRLSISIEDAFGKGRLIEAFSRQLDLLAKNDPDIIVLDAIRWWDQYDAVRRWQPNLVVGVDAPLEVRWQRLPLTTDKIGESTISLEEFKRAHEAPTETAINDILAQADVQLINDSMAIVTWRDILKNELLPQIRI